MRSGPRFLIGIDLGTTNCALAWADLQEGGDATPRVRRFAVPQLVAESEVSAQSTLPSFLYVASPEERDSDRLTLPWAPRPERVAGLWARDHGALLPGRLVMSAKSWLCHGDVDRRAPILPWDADPADRICSPVEASASYLCHLRDAWNHAMASGAEVLRLERQQVVLTVPASFDQEARELTVEAARLAGIEHLTLQEEPTAALYAWIAGHQGELGRHLRAGDTVLVCDVGGGTTDFTLVTVRAEGDELAFDRAAVGDHLLLGGDNVDLALSRLVESRLSGPALTLRQRQALRRQCAAAKERLLAEEAPERVVVSVLGAGRAVVGAARVVELTAEDVRRTLLEGFLPAVPVDDRPRHETRHGLRELGLPYETDAAVTRHLAAFLGGAAEGGPSIGPDAVLFNGGFFTPAVARARVVEVLRGWFGEDGSRGLRVLANASPATAVAEGAVCYGLVQRGAGVRIGGGSPRVFYLGLHAPLAADAEALQAICVLPRGTEEGTQQAIGDRELEVVANRPRAFSLWSSRLRRDALGDVVQLPRAEVHAHAPLVTELRFGKRSRSVAIPVRLETRYTELGTLELWLASRETDHRWRLQFELRGATLESPAAPAPESHAMVGEAALAAAVDLVWRTFGAAAAAGASPPDQLPALLEGALGLGRLAWPLAAIRPLADALLEHAEGRRRTAGHEARWLNLFGFCLRPGFGATLDEWRMSQARRVHLAGLAFPADVQCQSEWLVLWERVAGGLTAGQQQDLYQRHAPPLLASLARRGKRLAPQVERETWRLLASLERIPPQTRASLGDALMTRLEQHPDNAALWWALGRLGARTPTYGPLNTVVPAARAVEWIGRILAQGRLSDTALTALVDLAAPTGDAGRDLDVDARQQVVEALRHAGAPEDLVLRAETVRAASRSELQRRYGESLPEGLALTVGR